MNLFQGSWKTTLAGFALMILTSGPELYAFAVQHKMDDQRTFWIGIILFLLGVFSRDRNKTSQDDGLPPKIMRQTFGGDIVPVQDVEAKGIIDSMPDRKAEVIILPPKE